MRQFLQQINPRSEEKFFQYTQGHQGRGKKRACNTCLKFEAEVKGKAEDQVVYKKAFINCY